MAFCPNCGSQVTGRFCPNCGLDTTAAGSAASAGAGAGNSTYVPPSAAPPLSAPGLARNVACALCYLLGFITGIIFLVLSPYNRDRLVRFHAFQSIFLSVALFVIDIILGIFSGILWAAHAGPLVLVLWRLYQLATILGWLYLMYSAYSNRKIVIPVVGPLAEKQA